MLAELVGAAGRMPGYKEHILNTTGRDTHRLMQVHIAISFMNKV